MEFLDAFDAVSFSSVPRGVCPPPEESITADAVPDLLTRFVNEIGHGVMLVTDAGRVCVANRAALRECSSDRLCIVDGHVQARRDREHRMLFRAIASAVGGRRSMVTVRGAVGSLMFIAVVPLASGPMASAEAPSILLAFGRLHVCEPLSMEFFAREHQITPAELSVLRALCDGDRPSDIAGRCGVSLSTIRTQVTSLRRKTDSKSIPDLLRAVAQLPPIVSVLADRSLAIRIGDRPCSSCG
jgi:DNA-binding CsgD family transcriptional regulator